MIRSKNLFVYMNVEAVPFIMETEEDSRELCDFAEELVFRIAKKNKQNVVLPLTLSPVKYVTRNVVRTDTFKNLYKANILKVLEEVDAIAELNGLDDVSKIPDWLKDEAEKRYIPIRPFASFFPKQDSETIFVETSRRRLLLVKAVRPSGRYSGRGGRRK